MENSLKKKYVETLANNNFDWIYMAKLELLKLSDMKKYFNESNIVSDVKFIRRDLDICIKLLRYVIYEEIESDKLASLNTKNYKRFSHALREDVSLSSTCVRKDLYIKKAWHLYNKIRTYRMMTWWD